MKCICIVSVVSPSTSGWIQIPSQVQIEAQESEGGPVQNFSVTIKDVTASDRYFWGIDDRPNNNYKSPPGNLVTCARPCIDGNWIDGKGALDHIDSSSSEVWGINFIRDLYRKPVHFSNTENFTNVGHNLCQRCSVCDLSISNNDTGNGYLCILSCAKTVICSVCDGNDWMTIPHELYLTQIEAGDEEVWAVDATNHIFKRLLNGRENGTVFQEK